MTLSSKSKTKPAASRPQTQAFSFPAIGTNWQIDFEKKLRNQEKQALRKNLLARIEVFDKAYSRFRDDSLVWQMANQIGTYTLPDDARPLFDLYHKLYELTDGRMTPLIGQALSDAGYDADYSLKVGNIRRPPTWNEAIDYQFPRITIKQPVLIDLGAAGKGYLVDIIGGILHEAQISEFTINAGGDILHHSASARPTVVGLEHPVELGSVIGQVTICNQSLCGSAMNRRNWGDMTHILDPFTLVSPKNITALWTVAETALVADGLATALFFCSPEKLRQHFEFDCAMVHDDLSLTFSGGFPAEFF